jgi:integrase
MSIFPRGKKGVFYFEFEYRGKRYCRTTGKYTRREAEKVEREFRIKVEKEEDNPIISTQKPKTLSLTDAIERTYNDKWVRNTDSERTLSRAKKLTKYLGEDKPLHAITTDDIDSMIEQMGREGLSSSTINRYLATLKTILHLALVKWEAVGKLPYIKMFQEEEGRLRIFTPDEEKQMIGFLRSIGENEVADLIIVLADTGMRLNEALRIEKRDVNFDNGFVSIWKTKSKKPRSVPMTARVRGILSHRLNSQLKPFYMKDYQVEKVWAKMRRKLGYVDDEEYIIHSLRHTCGVSIKM